MLQRSDIIKKHFKRSFKFLFVTLTSLILAFFPGALIVAADNQDTPRPGINKANEKNNVKPGWSNKHSNTEFNWEEIQGGSSGSGGGGEGGTGGGTSNPGGGEGGTGGGTSNPGGGEGGTGGGTSSPGGGEGGTGGGTCSQRAGEGGTGGGTWNRGGEGGGGGEGAPYGGRG